METQKIERKFSHRVTFTELFSIFVVTALVAGLSLQTLGLFRRFELQTIDHRFELRSAFKRNVKPASKIVVFDRTLEDEPTQEEAASHDWMKPLLSYPLSRETLAEMVSFLAASGARAIVLDYDLPQYSEGDKLLAQAVYKARTNISGMPVLIANNLHGITAGNINYQSEPVTRSGVVRELEKLEPDNDATEKYTGLTGVIQDEDQVARRLMLKIHMPDGKETESVITKLLRSLNESIPAETPEVIDIDFISEPNANAFPVRSVSHLLNPSLKSKITASQSDDVSLKDAIVVIGDGITDVYDTPLTTSSGTKRSGAELLAQGLDTIVRRSWLCRLTIPQEYIYIALTAIIGGISFVAFRYVVNPQGGIEAYQKRRTLALGTDVGLFVLALLCVYAIAIVLFACGNLIVPLVVPGIAITLASLVTVLYERDRVRVISMFQQIESSQEKLVLAQEKHEAQLAYQASLADQRAMEEERRTRHDMVRRLNHDLKAPISVFNWTLAKVAKDRTPDDPMFQIFERLKGSSEHLSHLLTEILSSLENDSVQDAKKNMQICEISSVLREQAELERSLGEITGSEVILNMPEGNELTWVVGTELEIARIVDNIVGNALKHNPAGTRVEITLPLVDWSDSSIVVSIKDNGRGIAKEDLERIFQSGYRASGNRLEGEGLGLSIAQTLAHKIGGSIDVRSEVGKGTNFDISFQRYVSALDDTSDIRLDSVHIPYPLMPGASEAMPDPADAISESETSQEKHQDIGAH